MYHNIYMDMHKSCDSLDVGLFLLLKLYILHDMRCVNINFDLGLDFCLISVCIQTFVLKCCICHRSDHNRNN